MEALVIQVICLTVLFFTMTFCGLLPVILVMKNKSVQFSKLTTTLISMCNCLAGGVFIGMCFLGLFPYVHEKFNTVLTHLQATSTFPLAEFIVVIGFFLILTVEQSIIIKQASNRLKLKSVTDSVLAHIDHDDVKKIENEGSYVHLLNSESQDMDSSGGSGDAAINCSLSEQRNVNISEPARYVSVNDRQSQISDVLTLGHSHMHLVSENSSGVKHLILLIAISIHSLFEGIALGLQNDEVKILHLFMAVLIHETLVAFALGVNVAKLNVGFFKSLKYILTVTTSIPIGIVLGLLIGTTPGVIGDIISGVLQGIAAGIFIHVTFMELLPDEFHSQGNRLLKVLFFFVGFLIMAAVNFAMGDHDRK